MLACFVGRLHAFLLLPLTNALRMRSARRTARELVAAAESDAQHRATSYLEAAQRSLLSTAHAFVVWFSGLRGGVAFAIAAAAYGDTDFPTRCGGWEPSSPDEPWPRWCSEGMNDSLAILQTTMIIAIFTILAFGSTARDVAVFSRVLQPKRAPAAAGDAGIQGTMPTPRKGSWKSLDAWLTPRFTIAPLPVADSDSDSGLNGNNGHARTSHTHSYATSIDTQRAAVGLSDHKPAT